MWKFAWRFCHPGWKKLYSFCKLNFYKEGYKFPPLLTVFLRPLIQRETKIQENFSKFPLSAGSSEGQGPFCSYRCAETTQSSNGCQPVIREGLKMSVPVINTKCEPLRAANPTHGNWNTGLGRIPFSSIKYLKGNNEGKEEHSKAQNWSKHKTQKLAPGWPRGWAPLRQHLCPHWRPRCDSPTHLLSCNSGPNGWKVIAGFLCPLQTQIFTLCKLPRGKKEINSFPTILNVNPPYSLGGCTCCSSLGLHSIFSQNHTRQPGSQGQRIQSREERSLGSEREGCLGLQVKGEQTRHLPVIKQTWAIMLGGSFAQRLSCGLLY